MIITILYVDPLLSCLPRAHLLSSSSSCGCVSWPGNTAFYPPPLSICHSLFWDAHDVTTAADSL